MLKNVLGCGEGKIQHYDKNPVNTELTTPLCPYCKL